MNLGAIQIGPRDNCGNENYLLSVDVGLLVLLSRTKYLLSTLLSKMPTHVNLLDTRTQCLIDTNKHRPPMHNTHWPAGKKSDVKNKFNAFARGTSSFHSVFILKCIKIPLRSVHMEIESNAFFLCIFCAFSAKKSAF